MGHVQVPDGVFVVPAVLREEVSLPSNDPSKESIVEEFDKYLKFEEYNNFEVNEDDLDEGISEEGSVYKDPNLKEMKPDSNLEALKAKAKMHFQFRIVANARIELLSEPGRREA